MILPVSYANGFAPRDGQPLYPSLWSGCVFAAAPCLGPTGLTLRDWSGFGNHGLLTNMDPALDWIASDRYSLDFDATNDKVAGIGSVSSFNHIQNTGKFAIGFWAKFTANGTRSTIIGSTLSATEKGVWVVRENLTNYGTDAMRCSVFIGGGNSLVLGTTADSMAVAGSWNHWGFSSNDTATGQWYKNGIAVTTTSRFTPGDIVFGSVTTGNSNRTLTVGVSTWTSDILPMGGQLDDVRIYNRALNANDWRALSSRRGIAYELAPRRRSRAVVITSGFSALRPSILRGSR